MESGEGEYRIGTRAHAAPDPSYTGTNLLPHAVALLSIEFRREELFGRGSRGQRLGYGFTTDFAGTVGGGFALVGVVASVRIYFCWSGHEG
jgi:hypothetical protein